MQELYNGRRQELEQAHEKVKLELKAELEQRRLELGKEHSRSMAELETAYSS